MNLFKGVSLIDSKENYDANAVAEVKKTTKEEDPETEPEVDIVINNVLCSFSVQCHLDLREIALNGYNVEYRRENSMLTMRLRRPYTTASMWSSGRITCTGATSESQAKVAARRFARCLQKLGFPVHFQNFRIFNVLGSCSMPWQIRIANFSAEHRKNAYYEPELHPGVTYKFSNPKATLKIFSTGSITVTAASVNAIELAIRRIYPLVYEFRIEKSKKDVQTVLCRPMMQLYPATKFLDSPSTSSISSISTTSVLSEVNSIPSSSNSCNNILANARCRAAESWASKLQNKRIRYNDVNAMSKVKAVARSVTANEPPLPPKVLVRQDKLLPFPGKAAATTPRLPRILTTNRQPKPEQENNENHDNKMDWQT